MVIHESSQRTPAQAATMAGLRKWLEQKKCHYLIVDKDLIGRDLATAQWLAPYLLEASKRNVKLPVLTVSVPSSPTSNGAYLVVAELPGRSEEAIAIVEEALKRE